MSYVNSSLVKDEHIVCSAKYHWMIFLNPWNLLTLWITPLIAYFFDEMALTNKRFVFKTGFIARKTWDHSLAKVESVSVHQSVLGRILGYGDIIVTGTGGIQHKVGYISNPKLFSEAFNRIS